MFLRVKPISDDAKVMYRSHGHYHEGDSGLDVFFVEDATIEGKSTRILDLQIQCEAVSIDDNTRGMSYYLYPRSSISATPLRMSNSVGIIDAGYRGTLRVSVDNLGEEPYHVRKGQRLFQICSPTLSPISFSVVSELSATTRCSGGFGSTGS